MNRDIIVSAARRLLWTCGPQESAVASNFFRHLEDVMRKGCRLFVIYCRVSERMQNHKGNLRDQMKLLRSLIEYQGGTVVDVFGEIAAGWELRNEPDKRSKLFDAIAAAEKVGAVVVTESTDRYLRHPLYTAMDQDLQPTLRQFQELQQKANCVMLATLLHPDASPRKVRGHQSKRGQQVKGKKGGRPKKPGHMKRRRKNLLAEVRRMREAGNSLGVIAKQTNVPKPTIQVWLAR
jgi:DNA invertase Pin-like site-specific DNA recombinase